MPWEKRPTTFDKISNNHTRKKKNLRTWCLGPSTSAALGGNYHVTIHQVWGEWGGTAWDAVSYGTGPTETPVIFPSLSCLSEPMGWVEIHTKTQNINVEKKNYKKETFHVFLFSQKIPGVFFPLPSYVCVCVCVMGRVMTGYDPYQ